MQYDPIKKVVGNFFNRTPFTRILLYKLLDLLLLRSWHIHRELKRWAKTVGNNVHILDAGAGFGQYSYYLSTFNPNWNILSVDVKEDQVCDCNNFFQKLGKGNVVFKTADLVTFKQESAYDLVLSVDVMEHILEDVEVFKNFSYSLKPGGMLLISTPSDQGGSDVHDETGESFIDEHVRDGYNMQEIKDKLKSAGFSKVKAHYSYGAPGKLSWKLSMKYPLTMLNTSKLFFLIIPFYFLITYPISFILNFIDARTAHPTGTGLIVKAWK